MIQIIVTDGAAHKKSLSEILSNINYKALLQKKKQNKGSQPYLFFAKTFSQMFDRILNMSLANMNPPSNRLDMAFNIHHKVGKLKTGTIGEFPSLFLSRITSQYIVI